MKLASRGSARSSGFTLIELLIVFAILGVVAMLLMSALRAARSRSEASQCINNLRELTQANLRYAADNGGQFCFAMDQSNRRRWHGERVDVDESFDGTRGPLAPYLGREAKIKICPAFEGMLKGAASFEEGAGGYGYNAAYIGGSPENRWAGEFVSNIERPGRTVMFADTAMARAKGIQEYPFAEPWKWVTSDGRLAGDLAPSVHFRHNGRAHVAWCDGHISSEEPILQAASNIYKGSNRKYLIGWFGPSAENGYWNPRRQTAE